ncbi:putative LYS7-copper chaperone for superoxide dismutase Sod1p [Fusarium austroafricanum]|uniref:Superoxide dismutase 1 copper chaperone n=1 Tax=Fusarium austroafricanum TaxID=2364996 RepID=A0A8H4KR70_9HYPO|nr:putative LYS7-copper chaperone for superoxide dismutase Sod1p [Fusarium austroafricanum]
MPLKFTPARVFTTASLFTIAGYSAYQYRVSRNNFKTTPPTSSNKMTADNSFETLFAVPLSCDGCVKAVSDSLYKLGGISHVEGNLKDQLITVKGTAAPSAIVEAIQATGRDAILRGSGASNSAAVSILETFEDPVDGFYEEPSRDVRGLARMVQVNSGRTLVDLTIRGVSPGTYKASIRAYGDLKNGATSTGPIWSGDDKKFRGDLGVVEVGEDGRGATFVDHGFQIWEVIGHAMVLTRQEEKGEPLKNDKDTVVGIIARSAGMWDNDKTVCSCTGKTLWEERKDEVKKGML